MTQPGGNSQAPVEVDTSVTRVTRVALPPPPVAGLRTVARQRGAFDESLKTLRLPALAPRALAEADARGITARPVAPSSMLRSGPRLMAPASVRMPIDAPGAIDPTTIGLPPFRELDTVEELDDAEVIDDDPAATLERRIDPATTLERAIDPADTVPGLDPADTLVGDPADTLVGDAQAPDAAAWSRHGAPAVAIEDDRTPIVHVPHLAVPSPAVLVHAIVAPPAPAPRSRRWAVLVAAPLAVVALALGAAAWAMERTPAEVATITTSLSDVHVREASPPVAATRAEPAIVPAAVEVPAAIVPDAPRPATVPAVAPTIPPPPPILEPHAGPTVEPKPTIRASRRSARVRSDRRAPESGATAVEAAAPEPTIVRRVPPAASDATALLREAERAFAEGRYATALHFADRSRAKAPDARAARIAALAACRIGQAKKAKAAYLALPAGQRSSVRKQCSDRGIVLE